MGRGAARPVAATLVVVCLTTGLGACDDSAPTAGRSERSAPAGRDARPRTPPPATQAPAPLEGLPDAPPADDAAALASWIERVERVLADPAASERDVREAGEFEQLAARMLARGPDAYAAAVLGRLTGDARTRTRAHVEAATLLDAMSDPQPELPDWRIVEPPPPDELLGFYREAERQIGVPWEYLAAVHLVETRMGRLRGVSTAGAQGPMQFLPTTWDLYGQGGDIEDPRDAIFAAARLLRANGAPDDMAGALWHYNPSDNYVGAVTRYAEQMTPLAYRGYWNWRVLYKHLDGTYLLDEGYPDVPARKLD